MFHQFNNFDKNQPLAKQVEGPGVMRSRDTQSSEEENETGHGNPNLH